MRMLVRTTFTTAAAERHASLRDGAAEAVSTAETDDEQRNRVTRGAGDPARPRRIEAMLRRDADDAGCGDQGAARLVARKSGIVREWAPARAKGSSFRLAWIKTNRRTRPPATRSALRRSIWRTCHSARVAGAASWWW